MPRRPFGCGCCCARERAHPGVAIPLPGAGARLGLPSRKVAFPDVLPRRVRLHSMNKETMGSHTAFWNTVLWTYIVLLLVGGLIGFLKAGSKVSLITSAVAAAALVLAAIPGLFTPALARGVADAIMAALLVVFAVRLGKTRKFMPSGLLFVLTGIALLLRHL
jgi:uncharacterized membrane protein (UPF0136 family)